MKHENLKIIKYIFSKKYFNIKSKIKKAIPSKSEVVIYTSVLLPMFYVGAILYTGDPNPLTMRESYRQRKIEIVEERIVAEEKNKLKIRKLENLVELKNIALRKAENLDGQAGLTFIEQAELARELGYKGMLREGEIKNFRLEVDDDYFSGLQIHLNINKDQIKVSEESLRNYLEN